ncbi:ABC transporter substrate-binding protein [Pseudooceanicola sp. HF7]|uniref:ABC transporter substrate-binding protein n=1 Tax=Pseudooceanicola sp. HF7 TaxID=2721560 RepID=UPI001430AE47|nr:ABC transporter substrate-binding protein [Pseudooceanicola sp. HF7]NIZ08473.1 ABC transporter substrate-binding protein [Pseudooceanicola sp. HF7]
MKKFIRTIAAAAFTAVAALPAAQAQELEKLTYLFPAPDFLPAFSPFQVARAKGYYEDAGLDVTWQIGKGGADVAKQVAVGNVELGGGIGDTPIIVRQNGLPVKGVALLGGRPLVQILIRKESGVEDIAGLVGQPVGVIAYQDTTYYNLLAALSASGIDANDVDIQAVGAGGMVQLMISGDVTAISGTPDWAASIEAAGVELEIIEMDSMLPAMSQAILASEDTIAEKPEVVKAFVGATMQGLKDVMDDPQGSAAAVAGFVPQMEGKEAFLEDVMKRYSTLVYATPEGHKLGTFDADRVSTVAQFYLDAGIVTDISDDPEDYFTNAFAE